MKKIIFILMSLFVSLATSSVQAKENSDNISIQGCSNCDIDADIFVKIGSRIYFVLDKTNKSALFGYFNREASTDASLVYWDEKEDKIHNVYDGIDSRNMYYANGRFYLYKYKPLEEKENKVINIFSIDQEVEENDDNNSSTLFSIDKDGKNYKEYGDGEIIALDKKNDTLAILTKYRKERYSPYKEAEAKIDIIQKGKFIRSITLHDYGWNGKTKIIGDYIWYNAQIVKNDLIFTVTRLNWKHPEDKVSYDTNVCNPEYYEYDYIGNQCNSLINIVQNKRHIYAVLEGRSAGSAGATEGGAVYKLDLSSNKAELLYQIPDGIIDGGPEEYISPSISFDTNGDIKLSKPNSVFDKNDFIKLESAYNLYADHLPDADTDIFVENEKRIGNKVYAIITKEGIDVNGGVGWRDGYFNLKTWYVVKDLSSGKIQVMTYLEMKDNMKQFIAWVKESFAYKTSGWWKEATPQIVEDLIEKGADINAKEEKYGLTPLMQAAKNSNPDITDILIKYGADVNARDEFGNTPLMKVVSSDGNPEIIDILIKNGADVDIREEGFKLTPLMLAAKNSNPDITDILIKYGADVNATDEFGETPLMNAVFANENPEVVETLIKNGADIEAKSRNGKTAVMYATHNQNPAIIKTLINHNANVNAKDYDGQTALIEAVRHNRNPEIITTLIKHGANVNEKDVFGYTAWDYAKDNGAIAYQLLKDKTNESFFRKVILCFGFISLFLLFAAIIIMLIKRR